MTEQEQAPLFEEHPDPMLDEQLLAVGKWARLISVIGFSIGAFVVMVMLFSGAMVFRTIENAMPIKVEGMYGALIIVFFIFFFIAAAVLYFLYKAATLLKTGTQLKSNTQIAEGFTNLNRFFIAMAVFSALSLLANLSMLFQ